jgi:hypothetical protein
MLNYAATEGPLPLGEKLWIEGIQVGMAKRLHCDAKRLLLEQKG